MRDFWIKLLITTIVIGLLSLVLAVRAAEAQPDPGPADRATGAALPLADETPPAETVPPKDCAECHPDKHDAWMESPHAHSFDDPIFQEGWANMELAGDCLLCHKAGFDEATGAYTAEGTSCEACHGQGDPAHPPAQVPVLSDEEYCGICHPTTLGEVRLSGHSTANDVRCVDCHDPHSQKVLFENPDDMCKSCHDEDLTKMDEALGKLHLQENIACASCHTLDVPHTFLLNFQHEDTSSFFKGFDCTSEITASVANRAGTSHEVLGSFVQDQMNWPIVHRVSRLESAPLCTDCHIMDEKLRTDFMALGYSPEEVDQLSWESHDFPALTGDELAKLVATPKRTWGWVYWLAGVVATFGVFEVAVTRNLEAGPKSGRKENPKRRTGLFRRKPATGPETPEDHPQGEA
ncbi:MAG: multiheme c-type cytochrome [Chloroflexota bacterium]